MPVNMFTHATLAFMRRIKAAKVTKVPFFNSTERNEAICKTRRLENPDPSNDRGLIQMKFDQATVNYNRQQFEYVEDPEVSSVSPKKGTLRYCFHGNRFLGLFKYMPEEQCVSNQEKFIGASTSSSELLVPFSVHT